MTVIDVAGGTTGGAARWRREAEQWVSGLSRGDVRIIGRGERVGLSWLARRELLGRGERRIAANNVSFVTGRGQRVVLLRNALHFLRDGEAAQLPGLPAGMARQVSVVRAAARQADILVVPCTNMRERVQASMPSVRGRIWVRHHPITVRVHRRGQSDRPYMLYPSPPASYKDLIGNLSSLLKAMQRADSLLEVRVTATVEDLGGLGECPRVVAIGPQTLSEMDQLWAQASVMYAPSVVESFGYPVAEARALGIPVIAVDNAQNSEIGGDALISYSPNDIDTLAAAVARAKAHVPHPDPAPFDRDDYFRWLVDC